MFSAKSRAPGTPGPICLAGPAARLPPADTLARAQQAGPGALSPSRGGTALVETLGAEVFAVLGARGASPSLPPELERWLTSYSVFQAGTRTDLPALSSGPGHEPLLLLLLLSAADAQWDPYGRLSTAGPIPTPSEDAIARYPSLSGKLRLGIAAKLTRRDGRGAARVAAAARAVYDVNARNSTLCPAIADLGSAVLFNFSTDVKDHGGSNERAILAGFYFNYMVENSGFGLYGEPMHGTVGGAHDGWLQWQLPDENAIQRIQEAFTEIHEDPSMPRVIMLCAFQPELPEVLRQAGSMCLRNKEHNYVWFHPDDGNIDDPREAFGTFSVSWMPDSDRTPLFEEDDGDAFRYVENTSVTAQNNFAKCKAHAQLGYDIIVTFSVAMHRGNTTGKFTRETVTSSLLEEMLQEPVGDTSYGECLAGGLLTIHEDQERNLLYMVSNFYFDSAGNAVKADVVLVQDQMSGAWVCQATSDLAACSVDYPGQKCFKPNGEGPLDGGFPLGRAEICLDGTCWQRGEYVPADLGYFVPEIALNQSMPYMAQTACPVGSYASVSGQTACALSSTGYCVTEFYERGAVRRAEGTFADEKGQTSCDRCEVGRYQDEKGQSSYISCSDRRATLHTGSSSAVESICQVGTEYTDDTTDTCKPCPIGINCSAGEQLALDMVATATFITFGIFAFDLDPVRAECLFGSGATTGYVLTLLIPILLGAVLFGASFFSRLVIGVSHRLHMKGPETFNTYSTASQVYRFQDGAWDWGIIFLARNTFTGISVIIDPSRPYAQMMVMASVLTGSSFLSVLILPWRGNALNLSDAITCASLVILVAAAGSVHQKRGGDWEKFVDLGDFDLMRLKRGVHFIEVELLQGDDEIVTKISSRNFFETRIKTSRPQPNRGVDSNEPDSNEPMPTIATPTL
ncbi:unnamed protein product [Prorocentrum cordatum]|uniref:Tyrosine-protein kinase ephrin type A/B receptor-like domain-containing protein n=1 Tax=Prorocentrum cordatum TaxID=2364126 RepID=A0ABN9Q9M0_9DINO|nr:unnamed protein product [Polarella glacialis]